MRRVNSTCIVVAAVALSALCSPAQATFPGSNGRIAYVKDGDIWSAQPDGTDHRNLTPGPADDADPAWSPFGNRIAFASDRGGDYDIYAMDADGSDIARLTTDPLDDREPSWAPDDTRLVFTRYVPDVEPRFPCSSIIVLQVGGGETALDPTVDCEQTPEWSPLGSRIVFRTRGFTVFTVNPDGSGLFEVARFIGSPPHWSPGAVWLSMDLAAHTPDGTRYAFPTHGGKWSPDGSRLVIGNADIATWNEQLGDRQDVATDNPATEKDPDWQPVFPFPPVQPYVRPKGATPAHVSLVPAYRPCESPNGVHGPPLAFDSCSPPQPASDYLTVGTADANGQAAKFIGSVRLSVLAGDPTTSIDEADVAVEVLLGDVRCRASTGGCPDGALADYAGEIEAVLPLRITDRFNSGTGAQTATAELPFQSRLEVPCAPTTDTTTGSLCALQTTLDAVLPGQVRESKRSIWALGQVEVVDGGADGDASTDDYTPFAVAGLFVP